MSKKNTLSYKEWKSLTLGLGGLHTMLLSHWELIFRSVFKWNTEDTGNKELGRQIEKMLYQRGQVIFFYDNKTGYAALPQGNKGKINIYGEMNSWSVIGADGFNKNFNIGNSVKIRANELSFSPFAYVNYQVKRLVDIEETIDVNMNQLKVPIIFSGDENSLLTMKNVYKKIVDNDPVLYVDKSFKNETTLTGVPTGANYYGEQLMKLYNDVEGRLLKLAGLKYVHTEKKERLIVDEVNSNDGLSNTFLWSALEQRQIACEKINEMFGLNISVEINPLLVQSDPDKDDSSEGDEDVE